MTENNDMLTRLAARRSEHQDAIIDSEHNVEDTERYDVEKNKKSQALNSVSNAFTFKDKATDVKFNISVTVTAIKKDSKGELAPNELAELQRIVTEFLSDIHTKI